MAALFEFEGVIAPEPDQIIRGSTEIVHFVVGSLSRRPVFTLHESEVVKVGGLAFVRSRWTVSGDGGARNLWQNLVVRRQEEGHWLVVIERPVVEAEGHAAGT